MNRIVSQCPVCEAPLRVTELSCSACDTRLQGHFPPPPLARLPREHQQFVETFVRCRGILRDVERTLGISYPTVRAKLDAAVAALGTVLAEETPSPPPADSAREERRRELLRRVAVGEINAADAALALRHL